VKNLIKILFPALCLLCLTTNIAQASSLASAMITVENHTNQSINIHTDKSAILNKLITINGTIENPSEIVGPNSTNAFLIGNNQYTGQEVYGDVSIIVGDGPYADSPPCATFTTFVSSGYVGMWYDNSSHSNDQYDVYWSYTDNLHVGVYIYPAGAHPHAQK